MIFLSTSGKEVKLKNSTKYLIKWNGKCRSKIQERVKALIQPYWAADIVFEELRVIGTRLTIDFYNANKKIALEVDGNQHYKFNKFFHSNSRQKFLSQLQRDEDKEYFCEINNIKLVRILESDNLDLKTKVLYIDFPSQDDLSCLFTPNLVNIGFVAIGNTITVSLKNPLFRDYFNDWVVRFLNKIEVNNSSELLVDIFNNEIKALVLLGQKEKKISINSAKGLFGELVLLNFFLDRGIFTHSDILEAWHRPTPTIHDFDFESFTMEVKTISRSNTFVRISTEDQLATVSNKILHLCIFQIEDIAKSDLDSLGELYTEIRSKLNRGLANLFEIKCAEDVYCEYIGPLLMPLDYKFIIIDKSFYEVDQIKFPRIRRELLENGLTKVSYNLDLSSINDFRINYD